MAREVTRQTPQGVGASSFNPSVGVATPGLGLQAQPTQFDQLREVLLGPGMAAVNAAAEQGRQNQRMEQLRERARAKSDARTSEVAREFDIQHRQAAAAQAHRKYSQKQQRLNAVKNEQMNLLTDDRKDNPEWLHRQVAHQFNNAATQEEREAWFGLLQQTEHQVQQSRLDDQKKRAAEQLQSISLAGHTAHTAVTQMIDELTADPHLQEELMGDGTNIHSRTLEWVLAEAAQAAPDLFNLRRSDPDYDLKVEARDQIIAQLEKQAMGVGRSLIQQHTQRVDASNAQTLQVNLESLVWQYVQDPSFSLADDGESFQAAFDENVRNFGAHMHPAQIAKVRDSAIIQAAQDIGQLRGDMSLASGVQKLDELEAAAPHLRREIMAARDNFQRSASMRLDTNVENRFRSMGMDMPTNEQQLQVALSIINDEMDKVLMSGGVDSEGDLTDGEVQLVRALRNHVAQSSHALRQGVQTLSASQQRALLAAQDDRRGDAKDLWNHGPVRTNEVELIPENRRERERLQFAQVSQFNQLKNHNLPDEAVDYYLEGFLSENPESVHDTISFAIHANDKVWTSLRDGFAAKGGPQASAALMRIRHEIANSGVDLADVDWETYNHQILGAMNNTNFTKEALNKAILGEDGQILQERTTDHRGRPVDTDLTLRGHAVRRVYDIVADMAAQQDLALPADQTSRSLFGWGARLVSMGALDWGKRESPLSAQDRETILRGTLESLGGSDVEAITNLYTHFMANGMSDEEAAISTASYLQDNGFTFADTGRGPRLIYDRGALGSHKTDHAKLTSDAQTYLSQQLDPEVRTQLMEAFPDHRDALMGPHAQTMKDVIRTLHPEWFGSPGAGDEFEMTATFAFNHPEWRRYQNNRAEDGSLAPRALLLVRDRNGQPRMVTTPDGRPITLYHHSMVQRTPAIPTMSGEEIARFRSTAPNVESLMLY